MLLTHALALSASQFVHKKKSLRIKTSALELKKLTNTGLEDNLICHRGHQCLYRVDLRKARERELAAIDEKSTSGGIC